MNREPCLSLLSEQATLWTEQFRQDWETRFEALDSVLDEMKKAMSDLNTRLEDQRLVYPLQTIALFLEHIVNACAGRVEFDALETCYPYTMLRTQFTQVSCVLRSSCHFFEQRFMSV